MNVSLYHSFFHDYNLSKALYFAALMPPSLLILLAFIFDFLHGLLNVCLSFVI
jgi:Flp pilus assembly protein TadG